MCALVTGVQTCALPLFVTVAPSRSSFNVHVSLPVTLQEALLGATVTVPTVHGSVSMKIPPGSNSGTTLRLKGKGIPAREGDEIGDQYVKLRVMLPERPDQELRDFVENWGRSPDYEDRKSVAKGKRGEVRVEP